MFKNSDLLNTVNRLNKFSFRLTHNRFDSDDLLSDTLLRALDKHELFETGTNLLSWTSKIMFNIFVSQYRRKQKFETQYDPEIYIEKLSVSAEQDNYVETRQVLRAMGRLSSEHRIILMMICVEGHKYEDVSKILNIPIGTVRSRLARAKESIQFILQKNTPTALQA